jgi:putative intracellular protease/amidase
MAKKVLIIAGDGVEAQEIFYPYYRLKEAGYEVDVAAPSKKMVSLLLSMTLSQDGRPTARSPDTDFHGFPRRLRT